MRRRGSGSWWGRAALVVAVLSATIVAVPASSSGAQDSHSVTTQVVTSFDGTPILATLFVPAGASADKPAPLVLRTHGWGGTGQQEPTGFVGDLLDAGYVVLTWDQRGFGCSGGEVAIDKPDLEGRDVGALVDWAVTNAPVASEDGDPIVGMTGGSYAGGIQTAAVAVDDRIDAIAPEISWSDLRYSLYSGEVVNQGWVTLLYGLGFATATGLGLDPNCPTYPQEGGLDPLITQGFVEGATTGVISPEVLDFFAGSSLAAYGADRPVAVPTLVIQGSTDTLFDITDGYGIVEHVRAAGAPTRFMIFCGGHVACPPTYESAGDQAHTEAAVLAWFDRHLLGDSSVDVGPPVEYRTNEGVWREASSFPPAGSDRLRASGSDSLVSVPIVQETDPEAFLDQLAGAGDGGIPALPVTAAQLTPASDPGTMNVEVAHAADGPIEVVGIPTVELQVEGVGAEVILMAKLVDRESEHVLNLQEGAVRVPLTGGPVTVEVPMPGLAYTVPADHHLDLQVTTGSLMHSNARTPAQVDVIADVAVPAIGGVAASPAPERGAPAPSPTESAAPPVTAPVGSPTSELPATGAGGLSAAALIVLGGLVLLLRRMRVRAG